MPKNPHQILYRKATASIPILSTLSTRTNIPPLIKKPRSNTNMGNRRRKKTRKKTLHLTRQPPHPAPNLLIQNADQPPNLAFNLARSPTARAAPARIPLRRIPSNQVDAVDGAQSEGAQMHVFVFFVFVCVCTAIVVVVVPERSRGCVGSWHD